MRKLIKVVPVLLISLIYSQLSYGQSKTQMLKAAESTLVSGDTIQSIDQFRNILKVYPQSFTSAMRLAEIYMDRKDYHTAIQYCNIALDINENYLSQAEYQLATGKVSKDSTALSARTNVYLANQADMYHLKGKIRARQYKRQEAVDLYRQALEIKVDGEKLTDLALTYLETGLLRDALKLLHQAKHLDSSSYKPDYNLANVYYKTTQLDSALYYYQKVTEKRPEFKWPYLYMGTIHTQQQDYESALEDYSRFIKVDSADVEPYFRRAVVLSELRKWPQAISDWNKVLELSPGNAEAWRNKGLSHFQAADYDSAIDAFTEALKILPEESYTYINRGYSYYLSNQPELALEDLNKGLEGLPKYYLGYYFRALTYLQLKDKRQACIDAQMAVSLGMKVEDMDDKLSKKCRME